MIVYWDLRENEKLKNDAKSFRKINNTIIIEKVQKNLNASSQNLSNLKDGGNNKGGNSFTSTNITRISYQGMGDEEEKRKNWVIRDNKSMMPAVSEKKVTEKK